MGKGERRSGQTDRRGLLRMYHVTREAYLTGSGFEAFDLMLDLEYALDGEPRPNLVSRYRELMVVLEGS